jgi:hypothetical protein
MAQNEMEAMGGMLQDVRLSEWLGHDFAAPSARLERRTADLRLAVYPMADSQAQVPGDHDLVLVFIGFAQTVRHLGSPLQAQRR